MTLADLRFLFDRATGLAWRGLTSLRTRGWRASWQRVLKQFHRVPAHQRPALYLPAAEPFAPFAVPASTDPRASIVIPVYNQFAFTLACLRAIAAHPPAAGIEIIVVDDGSSDETGASLRQLEGLHYHRRAENGGFIAACNDGAALARGEYLVFLNNDTVPQPGWLDALLRTFDEHPGTGLAGAQLLYPDGRLQEAGGIVFADGSGWNHGRFESPLDPRFAFVREADYLSGAAIALPCEVFSQLGGFDTRYAPAYYEDTDLAFAIRKLGLKTLYQPAARVVHDEGATSGTDLNQGPKAYQVRNQNIFADKWRDALAGQYPLGTGPDDAALPKGRQTVLIIDALTPQPDRDSGSLRLVNLMRLLREEGAHVVFMAADRQHIGAPTQTLQQMGVEVWHGPHARGWPAWLREHGPRLDTVMVCRHYVMREMLPLLRLHAPQARVVFDTVDLHYLRERRGAEVAGDTALLRAAERTRALELDVIAHSDATLVVSSVERELLAIDAPDARVEILSNLHRVPAAGPGFEARRDLMFVGGFRHPPNVDAVRWFVGEVWPRMRTALPDMRFHCIGGDVPDEIRALHGHDGVEIHGHVPDLSPFLDGTRLAVAPLRYGAGVKGKVNQSMAHGQPVIATSCAVEGMHLRDGIDVLVADTPEAFADAVVRAYRDGRLWQTLATHARANVERHFSLDAGRDVVRRVLLGYDDRQP
ncbi:glycosyltransferase [Marilutibacter alkalisoli]|uniref:Glycosyltransferase n=1 Tax=Marilutibacter alkalisoli TaxID=2591633 RepID=A0A514BTZ6_9GAMM|nr:glycosyltransferase [Lysobacter alkalisoli]QDH70817.1 glycosyltransferase [Lysobacter alkalisoli]